MNCPAGLPAAVSSPDQPPAARPRISRAGSRWRGRQQRPARPQSNRAEPASIFRPSAATRQPTTTCGSPPGPGRFDGPRTGPARRAARPGRHPRRPRASRAVERGPPVLEPDTAIRSASEASGHQTSADRSRPATGPAWMRIRRGARDPARTRSRPEMGVRRMGPHTGSGAGGTGFPDRDRAGNSMAGRSGQQAASATTVPPSQDAHRAVPWWSTAMGVASGGGRRSVTSAGPRDRQRCGRTRSRRCRCPGGRRSGTQ